MEGEVLVYHQVSDEFRQRYNKRFGNDIYVVYACNAYEFALLVGRLFGEGKSYTAAQIMTKLKNVQLQESFLGRYSFRNDSAGGQFYDFPIYLMRIVGNSVVRIDG